MLAIPVILRNQAILMFLVNWGIMVIMMNLSNFCDSGESDGSGDSGASSDFGHSPSSDVLGEIVNLVNLALLVI